MAVDHRILQQIGVNSNAPALNMFQNALNSAQNRRTQAAQVDRQSQLLPFQLQQQQQQVDANQQSAFKERSSQRLLTIHETGQRLKQFLASEDTEDAIQFLQDNIARVQARNELDSVQDITESIDG